MLHYYPRHVSCINMPILRRTNCILTASGIVALCKRLHSTPVKSGLQSALNRCTVYCIICLKEDITNLRLFVLLIIVSMVYENHRMYSLISGHTVISEAFCCH